jgi:uncharacterized protein (DUF4415 family)
MSRGAIIPRVSPLPGAKEMVTLRLDPDVLAWFRKSGRGYQTRINAVPSAFVEAEK